MAKAFSTDKSLQKKLYSSETRFLLGIFKCPYFVCAEQVGLLQWGDQITSPSAPTPGGHPTAPSMSPSFSNSSAVLVTSFLPDCAPESPNHTFQNRVDWHKTKFAITNM